MVKHDHSGVAGADREARVADPIRPSILEQCKTTEGRIEFVTQASLAWLACDVPFTTSLVTPLSPLARLSGDRRQCLDGCVPIGRRGGQRGPGGGSRCAAHVAQPPRLRVEG